MNEEAYKCRGCGLELTGSHASSAGFAYHPETRKRCPWNYYGGHVCSEQCDRKVCLELERSMPGHSGSQRTLGQSAEASVRRNWSTA